jgi:hypothetical protein
MGPPPQGPRPWSGGDPGVDGLAYPAAGVAVEATHQLPASRCTATNGNAAQPSSRNASDRVQHTTAAAVLAVKKVVQDRALRLGASRGYLAYA